MFCHRLIRSCVLAIFATTILDACAGTVSDLMPGRSFSPGARIVAATTADYATNAGCSVSADGFLWYAIPAGSFPPIDFTNVDCTSATTISADDAPAIPKWATPITSSQTVFVATSLQETPSQNGAALIEADATKSAIPITWMIGDTHYLSPAAITFLNDAHAHNGDDVELERSPTLYALARGLPWYAPSVSVEGAGRDRNIPELLSLGNSAFWGITWNSHGTDGTSDEGAPWGAFCADPSSYKRPEAAGSCRLLSFEWTARDLTRAYFQDTNPRGYSSEAAYSTDPDDVLDRGGFSEFAAVAYERSLVDAYAAAGESQPMVMMSQQETADEGSYASDDPVLGALYDEVRRDGLTAETLRTANASARTFAAAPRAVAFPFIAGGNAASFDSAPFTPATIDFHDGLLGATFVSGHTMPSRIFDYALDPLSSVDTPLVATMPGDATYPKLTSVIAKNGGLVFGFTSPIAQHFAIALWTTPGAVAAAQTNVYPAGRAGLVATFDLPSGPSLQALQCSCPNTTLAYSR